MTFEIGLLLVIILLAVILFSIDRNPADIVAMGVLLTLIRVVEEFVYANKIRPLVRWCDGGFMAGSHDSHTIIF